MKEVKGSKGGWMTLWGGVGLVVRSNGCTMEEVEEKKVAVL